MLSWNIFVASGFSYSIWPLFLVEVILLKIYSLPRLDACCDWNIHKTCDATMVDVGVCLASILFHLFFLDLLSKAFTNIQMKLVIDFCTDLFVIQISLFHVPL